MFKRRRKGFYVCPIFPPFFLGEQRLSLFFFFLFQFHCCFKFVTFLLLLLFGDFLKVYFQFFQIPV